MKLVRFAFLIFGFVSFASAQAYYGSNDEKAFRDGRNIEMCDRKETPLKPEDYLKFRELVYFPSNPGFRVEAKFFESADEKEFNFQTSAETVRKYLKKGTLNFEIGGRYFSLSVFQSKSIAKTDEYFDLWFVPFKDLTNAKETYGGGRYLSIWKPKDGKAILDFNLAYNPSCAYGSGRFSCPIPPKENFLRVEIAAGEKKFVSQSGNAHE